MLLLPKLLQQDMLQTADAWAVTNAISGLGMAGAELAEQQLQELLSAFSAKLPGAQPASISSVMFHVAKLQLPVEQRQWQQLTDQLHTKLQLAKPRDISTALSATCLTNHSVPEQQFVDLVQQLVCQITEATALDISRCFWTAAEMGWQLTEQQQYCLLNHPMQQLPHAGPMVVGDTLCAAGRMGMRLPAGQIRHCWTGCCRESLISAQKLLGMHCGELVKSAISLLPTGCLSRLPCWWLEFEAALHIATCHDMSKVLQAVAVLHALVPNQLLQRIVLQLLQHLPQITAAHVSFALLWIASLQLAIPKENSQRLLDHLLDQVAGPPLGLMSISTSVYSAGRLGLQIKTQRMQELVEQYLQLSSSAGAYSISTMLCGVVALGQSLAPQQLQTPCWAMLARFEDLLADATAKDINRVFFAIGAEQHSNMYKRQQLPKPMQLWRQMLGRMVADMSGPNPDPKTSLLQPGHLQSWIALSLCQRL